MQKPFQLELFKTKHYQPDSFKKAEHRQKFFGFIKLHEKAISIIIASFIISLISFSLGVERGKNLTVQTQTKGESKIEFKSVQIPPTDSISENKLVTKEDLSRYTVQVATFKTKVYAQKEAERLEKKGMKALVIPSGQFIIVCVGNFSEKQEAKLTLNQLKETYRDCFIRRL